MTKALIASNDCYRTQRRPFLNTAKAEPFSELGFLNLSDQIGAFLGGASDVLEHKFNSLAVQGRQSIAAYWRKDITDLGDAMRRGKPQDIRNILENKLMQHIDAEEQAKLMRFALEMSRLNSFLGGKYDSPSLKRLSDYQISLALEQDASSSGAQIIALTTKNKQLAELSNVVPTDQKKRLYDEIAHTTFNDPRFRELNIKFGLSEKDLRKAKICGLLKLREFRETPLVKRSILSQAYLEMGLKVQRPEKTACLHDYVKGDESRRMKAHPKRATLEQRCSFDDMVSSI